MRSMKHLHPLHQVSVYKVGHSLTDAFTIFIIYAGAISIANIKIVKLFTVQLKSLNILWDYHLHNSQSYISLSQARLFTQLPLIAQCALTYFTASFTTPYISGIEVSIRY